MYQLHRCRMWLPSRKCHSCSKHQPSKSNYPAEACPLAACEHCIVHEKPVLKSSCHNWITSLRVRPFLTATIAAPPKREPKRRTSPRERGTNTFKFDCLPGLVFSFWSPGSSVPSPAHIPAMPPPEKISPWKQCKREQKTSTWTLQSTGKTSRPAWNAEITSL